MSYVSLGRFSLKDEPGMGPCWTPPVGVTALIDLVPPALDAEPDVNFAVMLSDAPLDSNDCHHSFGEGHVTEMQMTGAARDAWEAVTGYWPRSGTIGNCVAEHLLRSPGQDRANPLTCGKNRGLEVHLGGKIWDHTLTGLSDPLALPVLQIEAEGLATIYREQGETQYRLAMGGVRKWYKTTSPIKELIQFIFPNGRDDLPLLDELEPKTLIIEMWPTIGGAFNHPHTSVVWSGIGGPSTWSVVATGKISGNSGFLRNDHVFGGNNRDGTFTVTGTGGGWGLALRSDATAANMYACFGYNGTNYFSKSVSGNFSHLLNAPGSVAINDTRRGTIIGSTWQTWKNGVILAGGTDTAVPAGTYSGVLGFSTMSIGPYSLDDLISGGGGGGGNSFLNLLLTGVG